MVHEHAHHLPLNRQRRDAQMLRKRGKGIGIACLITPIEYRTVKSDRIPAAQFKVRQQHSRGFIRRDHQNKGAFVAHKALANGTRKIGPGHQRHGIDAQIGGHSGIVGKTLGEIF